MDDHEFDGHGRSSYSDQTYRSDSGGNNGAYRAEVYVPSPSNHGASQTRANTRAKAREPFQPKPAKQPRSDSHGETVTARAGQKPLATIVGSSAAAAKLRETIELYAEDDAPVLITGETGVGKELVARHLHGLSPRRTNAFSALNAGAMPESLASAELFGHAKGAFTGAVAEREGAIAKADGGILFLDEIGEMPLSIQTHLLRVLEDGVVMKVGGKNASEIDFRLIAATNADLKTDVCAGKFRRDLFYRINVLVIDVPPLRARGDDIVEIAEAMIAGHKKERYRKTTLTPNAADRLRAHPFPGNVRELRNILARALVHARNGKILPDDLQFDVMEDCAVKASGSPNSPALLNVDEAKALISRFLMMKALHTAEGNVTKAATLTGRSRGTLHAMKKDLEGEDFAAAYQTICTEIKVLLNEC